MPDWELLSALSKDTSRIAFAATRGGEAALGDEDASFFTFEFLKAVQNANADFAHVGFMTISSIADVMEPRLAQLARQHRKPWHYTLPIGLDDKAYPGTFVFLNPKVPQDVESNFAKLIQSKGQLPVNEIPRSSEFYYQQGLSEYKNKDYNKAITDYSEAIRLNPSYTLAYNNRGKAYSALKQYDKAISDCNDAIRIDPNHAKAYNTRGIAYSDLKQYHKAISDYNDAIRIDPNFALAYNNRGVAYNALKQYDKAISDYNDALRLDPNLALAYNNRGKAYNALKQYDKAISDYNDAIRLDPSETKPLRGVHEWRA